MAVFSPSAFGYAHWSGYCQQGGQKVVTNSARSSTNVQQTYPQATVTVTITGTASLATLYSDNDGTPLANPFTCNSLTGFGSFYVTPGLYDIQFSGTGVPAPYTWGSSPAAEPFGFMSDITGNADSLSTLCARANSAGQTLMLTQIWPVPSGFTCNATLQPLGGLIRPAANQTVSIKIQGSTLQTICDLTAGGTCSITTPDGVNHPEHFGARADNSTASKAGIDAAIAQAQTTTQFQRGTYLYAGKMSLTGTNGKMLIGMGTDTGNIGTVISFTDSSQNSAIEIVNSNSTTNLTLKDITINGPGSGAGTMRGLYSHSSLSGNNGLILNNVQFSNFSSNCIDVEDFFMTRYDNTWAHDCGGDGLYSALDNVGPVIINSRHFFYNIAGYALNVQNGAPFIDSFNAGSSLGAGMKFGSVGNIVKPTIISANIEGITTMGGECITFGALSNFAYVNAMNVHCYADTVAAGDVIHWANPIGQIGTVVGRFDVNTISTGSWASPNFVADGCSSNEGLFVVSGFDMSASSNATLAGCIEQVIANPNGLFQTPQPISTLSHGTVTVTGFPGPGTGTSNTQETVVTTPVLTTAAGGLYEFAVSNNLQNINSFTWCSLSQGTDTTGYPAITYCQSNGGATLVDITNFHPSVAFNGTFKVTIRVSK